MMKLLVYFSINRWYTFQLIYTLFILIEKYTSISVQKYTIIFD